MDSAGIQFNHPLVRAAVYHAAPFAERAAAHLKMADTLRGQPDRYAWHLAAAALEPDERVASLLEETAAQAQRRGGGAAAARALERAAELSPGQPDQARRLLAAGELARHTGQSDWVQELAARVLTLTTDPELRITARYLSGWATHLVQPAHRRAPHAHLRRRAGIVPAAGHRLERHRAGRDGRLPLRNPGRPPGGAHHL